MEEVVKNTHAFIDILCMARGQSVQGWDEDTFQKAFKWAQYFEQVHTKLKSKPKLAEKLDRYLNNFNKTKSVYLGSLHMSFSQLAHSKSILRTFLLQNPYLHTEQFANVLKLYGINIGVQNETKDVENLQRDVKDLMVQKGTLKILSQMRNKLAKDCEQTYEGSCNNNTETKKMALGVCTTDTIARQAVAELLSKYALHIIEISGQGDQCINDKLDAISNLDDGMETITTCLLYFPDDCLSPVKANAVQTYIVTWLLDNIKRNPAHHPIWTLPVQFLSALAYKYQGILTMYLDQLASWANTMIPVFTFQLSNQERSLLPNGEVYVWRSEESFGMKDGTDKCTFETLVNHFLYLLQGPAHVQELCKKTIKNNIINKNDLQSTSQGTANQLGVHVWKDLWKALPVDVM